MQAPDVERWERVQSRLAEKKISALVCRLTENVVMLSGYWPILGRSVVIFPAEGKPVLLAPVSETGEAERGWISDVRTFRLYRIGDMIRRQASQSCSARSLPSAACSGSASVMKGLTATLLPPRGSSNPGLASTLCCRPGQAGGNGEWVDFGPQLVDLSGIKTEREIARVRLANEVADFGLAAFFRETVPGRKESEIAAAVESAILTQGIGYKGVAHARGEAEVISGPRTGSAWDFPTTTDRVVEEGDLVLIEFAVVADGYWSDLTRTVVAGTMNDEQRRLAEAQRAAYQAALQAMKPGVPDAEPDAAARKALDYRNARPLCSSHRAWHRFPLSRGHPLRPSRLYGRPSGRHDHESGARAIRRDLWVPCRG